MKDQHEAAPTAIPEGVQGNQVIEAMKGLEELLKAGGTMFRSKHHGARQIRKKARLRKRLAKAGTIKLRGRAPVAQKKNEDYSSKLERKIYRKIAKAAGGAL